jgi:hypothetical protein
MIGQQEQALAVVVEAPGGVDARLGDVIGERSALLGGAELADHTTGLVERQQADPGAPHGRFHAASTPPGPAPATMSRLAGIRHEEERIIGRTS